jgi:hypothetical protein
MLKSVFAFTNRIFAAGVWLSHGDDSSSRVFHAYCI